ncbi:MAG: STAS domain-containing protein [Desulfococcaceae bacterium]
MEISVTQKNDRVHFVLHGDVDEKGAALLSRHFQELGDKKAIRELVLDLGEVNYIGSSGIGLLILFYQTLASSGGKVRIEKVSPAIYDLFLELDIQTILSISKA